MKKTNVQKLSVAGILCAVAVVGSMFSFPIFGSKCAPVQHMVNIICAVLLLKCERGPDAKGLELATPGEK